jgi:hypothetical protein
MIPIKLALPSKAPSSIPVIRYFLPSRSIESGITKPAAL